MPTRGQEETNNGVVRNVRSTPKSGSPPPAYGFRVIGEPNSRGYQSAEVAHFLCSDLPSKIRLKSLSELIFAEAAPINLEVFEDPLDVISRMRVRD